MTTASIIRAGTPADCQPWPRYLLRPPAWAAMAAALADEPDIELLSLWADTMQVHALFHMRASSDFLLCSVPVEAGDLPGTVAMPPGGGVVRADDPRSLGPCRPGAR